MALALTPIQTRMLAVLRDGMDHKLAELHACLEDELGPKSNVHAHLTALRDKIRPMGDDIVCVARGLAHFYRIVPVRHVMYSKV